MSLDDSTPSATHIVSEWMEALSSGNVEDVVDLYAEDAVLVPTFGSDPLYGIDAVRGYFMDFIGGHPGLHGTVHGEINQPLDEARPPNIRSISGTYTFEWDDGVQDARFTFVVVREDAEWVIHTHHSSVTP